MRINTAASREKTLLDVQYTVRSDCDLLRTEKCSRSDMWWRYGASPLETMRHPRRSLRLSPILMPNIVKNI